MSHLTLVPQSEHLIRDAYEDFLLSRQAAPLWLGWSLYRIAVSESYAIVEMSRPREPL